MNGKDIRTAVDSLFEEMVSVRRYLHANPELSFDEYKTTEYLIEKLKEYGIEDIRRPTETGAVAVIHGKNPGKTIAIRADIDALPIQECNDLPFCSTVPGVMHACGHDGHAAMLLTAARIFNEHKDEFNGDVVCIFQHAEEVPPGGAVQLYNAGVMNGVDELYGLHLSSNYPTGKFGTRTGALTSATDRFDIKVIGKGGHSSMPEQSIDPLVMGAQIILALQTILSRRIRAFEPAVLSVCQANAGDAYNIIPGEMTLIGSVRTFSESLREQIPGMIEQIVAGITASSGGTYEFVYEKGYSSVINDEAVTNKVIDSLKEVYGEESVLIIDPVMPGEDFSALHQECPACFVEIGTRNPEKGTDFPHHNAKYVMDEEGMRFGAGYIVTAVLDSLKEQK